MYSAVSGAPASTVIQTLGPAVPCAVQNLFAAESVTVQQMRDVRDEHLTAPAGAFLSEVLERHSADLAGLLADEPALAAESRQLLHEAARVARDGASFDDELLDRAGRLVDRPTRWFRARCPGSRAPCGRFWPRFAAHARGRDRGGKQHDHAPVPFAGPAALCA